MLVQVKPHFIRNADKNCKAYYTFLENNWTKNDKFYSFKGNPDYWREVNYETYVKDECLLGLTKEQIKQLFGEPTKSFSKAPFTAFIYCLDLSCTVGEEVYAGSLIRINFKNDIAIKVFTNPTRNDIPDNSAI
jgi:hypothetical protein